MSTELGFLGYAFMQRALVAGLCVAVTSAVLGIFLVLKRDAMLGHGLAHVTFGGVALGLLLEIDPYLTALGVAIISALTILRLKAKAGLHGDTGIGIFSSIGMAFGIVAASVAGNLNVDIFGYLFGSILAITRFEVWGAAGLALLTIIIIIFFYHQLLYVTFDAETAQASGIKAQRMDQIMAVLTAVLVVVGMKIVGLLLVAALIVIPAAAALQVARAFWQALILAAAVATASVLLGLYLGFARDWPVSGSTVLIASCIFLLLFTVRRVRQ